MSQTNIRKDVELITLTNWLDELSITYISACIFVPKKNLLLTLFWIASTRRSSWKIAVRFKVLSFDGLSLSYGQTNQDCMAVGICRDGFFFWTWHIFEGRSTPFEGKNVVLLQQPSPNQSKTVEMLDTRRRVSILFQELSKVVSPVRAELKARMEGMQRHFLSVLEQSL